MEIYKNLMYVSSASEEQVPLSDKLIVNQKVYYRYMDKIYIPETPSKLSKEDVAALSEIRIKLNGDVIDYSYTKELINTLIKKAESDSIRKLVDFGCGGGILAEVLTQNLYGNIQHVIGLDISDFAIKSSKKSYESLNDIQYDAHLFDGSERLSIEDSSIDAIFSSFVMHFPIYDNQLEELHRILKPNGCFIYNDYVYNKYPAHTKKIVNLLKNIGFELEEGTVSFLHPDSNDLKLHKIIKATKVNR